MKTYKMPVLLNEEDKVFGGILSARQFIFLTGGFLLGALPGIFLPGGAVFIALRIILFLIPVFSGVLFAFGRVKGFRWDRYIVLKILNSASQKEFRYKGPGTPGPDKNRDGGTNRRIHFRRRRKGEILPGAQEFLGIVGIYDGVIQTSGGYCLVLEAGTINYSLLSGAEQDELEEAFGRLLFSLTFDLQFYVQTRALDLTGEVEKMERLIASLAGPLQNYTRLFCRYLKHMMTYHSVLVRRYFLVLSWRGPGTLSEALPELERRAALVADGLSRCGGLSFHRLQTDELVELIYNTCNKHRAAHARVRDASGRGFLDLFTKGRRPEFTAAGKGLGGGCELQLDSGVPGLKDIMAPDGFWISTGEDLVHVGFRRLVRTLFAALVPGRVAVGWLDPLYNFGDVDISIHLRPGRDVDVINQLSRKITVLESQRLVDLKRGDHHNLSRLERAVKDAWQLRDAIQMGTNRMFFVTVLAAVAADDLKGLNQKCALLEETLAGRSVHVRSAYLQQDLAYKSATPLGNNYLSGIYRNFDLGAAISLFPLSLADLAHTDGIFLGFNLFTGAPVFFNNFLFPVLTNFNLNIFGKSGSGKSATVKLLSARSAVAGVKTVFLDVEGEYEELIGQLGGQSLKLSPNASRVINIFDLEEEEEDGGKKVLNLLDKVLEVKGLIMVMIDAATREKETLTAGEMAALEEAIFEEYKAAGIVGGKPETLYTSGVAAGENGIMFGRRKKMMPTLSSLYRRLTARGEETRHLTVLLKPFLRGMTLGLFDGQTNVDLMDAPLISFNLSRMEENYLRPVAMHVLLQWLWEKFIKKNPHQRKRVVAEEAWVMLLHQESARFLEQLSKRGRKRGCSLLVSSQSFKEFFTHPQGKAMLTNAGATLLMKQDATDIDHICESYHLSHGERDFLLHAGVGEALLRIDRQSTAVRIAAADFERQFLSTTVIEG